MIYGQVDHDAAGPWGALMGEIMHPSRQASWTIAVPETNRLSSGKLCIELYPLEAITWHAGKRGAPAIDNYDPSLLGNVTLLGIENADDGSGRLTDYQEMVWEEISLFLRENCPNVTARPPAPRVTHWWHQWLSSTTCPNGRVIYERLMPRLEEDMTDEQWSTLQNVQKQTLELLHLIKGGALGSQKGLEYAKSVWGRLGALEAKLDTMPTLATDAKAIVDEVKNRL